MTVLQFLGMDVFAYFLHRFLPVVKSSWFISCFAEMSSDESDLATHLSLVCSALSLLHAVTRSAEVLRQLCLSASCKPIAFSFINHTDLLIVVQCIVGSLVLIYRCVNIFKQYIF